MRDYTALASPKDSVVKYEAALKSDKFLVLAHGTAAEVAKARDIMHTTRAVGVEMHEAEPQLFAGGSGRTSSYRLVNGLQVAANCSRSAPTLR